MHVWILYIGTRRSRQILERPHLTKLYENYAECSQYKRRNVKRTDWNTYQSELSAKVGLWIGSLNSPADIERELNKLNSAIISSYNIAVYTFHCY